MNIGNERRPSKWKTKNGQTGPCGGPTEAERRAGHFDRPAPPRRRQTPVFGNRRRAPRGREVRGKFSPRSHPSAPHPRPGPARIACSSFGSRTLHPARPRPAPAPPTPGKLAVLCLCPAVPFAARCARCARAGVQRNAFGLCSLRPARQVAGLGGPLGETERASSPP